MFLQIDDKQIEEFNQILMLNLLEYVHFLLDLLLNFRRRQRITNNDVGKDWTILKLKVAKFHSQCVNFVRLGLSGLSR